MSSSDDWQRRAKCVGIDDIFSSKYTFFDTDHEEKAVAICLRCPVRYECLAHALDVPERYGVWGGLTQDQRKTINVRRSRVHCPGCGTRSVVLDTLLSRVELCQSCGLSWQV